MAGKKGQVPHNKGGKRPIGSGRAKGSANKSTLELRDCIMEALGKTYEERLRWFQFMKIESPSIFAGMVTRLIPSQLELQGSFKVEAELAAIANRTQMIEDVAAQLDEEELALDAEEKILELEAQHPDLIDREVVRVRFPD